MAQDCVTIPTATLTSFFTSSSFTTVFTTTPTTLFTVTTTSTSFECSGRNPLDGVCPTPGTTTKTDFFAVTTPETTEIVTVPITTIESDIVHSTVITLFSTSCSQGTSPGTSPDTTIGQSTTPTSSSSSESSVSNGSQSSTAVTYPSNTPSDTLSGVPSQSASGPAPVPSTSPNNNNDSVHLGAIIGGAVGGVVGLAAIILVIWFFQRLGRRRRDDMFDRDNDSVFPSDPAQTFPAPIIEPYNLNTPQMSGPSPLTLPPAGVLIPPSKGSPSSSQSRLYPNQGHPKYWQGMGQQQNPNQQLYTPSPSSQEWALGHDANMTPEEQGYFSPHSAAGSSSGRSAAAVINGSTTDVKVHPDRQLHQRRQGSPGSSAPPREDAPPAYTER